MKIGIVGYGYVGRAFHKMFGDDIHAIYDPFYDKTDSKKKVNECELAIVCVPTQMDDDGKCDVSIVEETIDWLETPTILIKSTVAIGTTDRLKKKTGKRIVFSPEYIGEGGYFTPFWMYPDPKNPLSHGFMVLGGDTKDTAVVSDIFICKMGPHTKFTFLTAKEAEAVKYWENIWGAMKVIFSNSMCDYLEAMGIDYNRTREGWAADPRVERMHTAVFKNARGFSGKCYPKDLRAFMYSVEKAGKNPTLLKEIWNINCDYRPDEFKKVS